MFSFGLGDFLSVMFEAQRILFCTVSAFIPDNRELLHTKFLLDQITLIFYLKSPFAFVSNSVCFPLPSIFFLLSVFSHSFLSIVPALVKEENFFLTAEKRNGINQH